jgi:hypothetical protein
MLESILHLKGLIRMDDGYTAEIERPTETTTDKTGNGESNAAPPAEAALEAAAEKFLGRWQRLISTTNWEKGRIIFEWREALVDAGAAATVATDEVWSRLVSNVTPQHVGRLRRVYQRFNDTRVDYPGLFWSHFQAVLDWDDAEMWLEGAVQNGWSISQMQGERSQTLGALTSPAVEPEEIVDEDAVEPSALRSSQAAAETMAEVRAPEKEAGEFDASPNYDDAPFEATNEHHADSDEPAPARPFERLPKLPDDLRDAVEGLKLVIVQYRLAKWHGTSRDDILLALDALRELTLAPLG